MGVVSRDYHQLSQSEVAGAQGISRSITKYAEVMRTLSLRSEPA